MSAYQLPPFMWPATVVAVCAVAGARGGRDERQAAGTLLFGWLLTVLTFQRHSDALQAGGMVVDIAMLALFVQVALRSARHWPLYAAAFQLLCVATHAARALDPSLSTWAYLTAGILWSYLEAGAIGYGAWTARRGAVLA